MSLEKATCLAGRCDPEAFIPYQPFVEALEWFARECPRRMLEAAFREVESTSELAQLVPWFERRLTLGPERIQLNAEGNDTVCSMPWALCSRRRRVPVRSCYSSRTCTGPTGRPC